jgi:hypothetical protein
LFVIEDTSEEISDSENTKRNDEPDCVSAYIAATMASAFVTAATVFSMVMAV